MSRIALVTDSTAYLPPERVQEYGTHAVPLYIHLNGKTFQDGVDIGVATFYERLKTTPKLPPTSQPAVGDFMERYRHLSAAADAIVSIHISSGISGTVNSALTARRQLLDELADPPKIYVIDSRTTSNGLALLVSAAARAIADGQTADQVVRKIAPLTSRVHTIFVVDTLEYLRKGGRIDVLAKVRTARKAKQRLLEIVAGRAGEQPLHACIVHAQVPQEAERVREYLADHFDCRELFVVEFSPVIAVHVGPGSVGVAFYAEEGE